jgi:ABC-type uncharacterized transport system permease subunit
MKGGARPHSPPRISMITAVGGLIYALGHGVYLTFRILDFQA